MKDSQTRHPGLHRSPRAALCWLLLWLVGGSGFLVSSARAYVLEGYSWPKNQPIVLDLQLGSPGRTLLDGSTSWDQVAEAALDIWNPYLGSGVQLEATATSATPAQKDGKNSVFFSNTIFGKSFGSDTLAITLTFYNPNTHTTDESDVVFNSAKPFDSYRGPLIRNNAGGGLADLRRVAIHEFGHVLGLDHVDQSTTAIMTPITTDIDTIQADDIAGVTSLYGIPVRIIPVISSDLVASATVYQAFTYQITATNVPAVYEAQGLPAGLSVSSATGLISGTPTLAGVFTVTLGATNSAGSGTATLVLTVNGPPVISGPLQYSTRLGQPFRYVPTTSNSPTGYMAYQLPAGLSLDSTSGVISGTPTVAGAFTVTIYAVNSFGSGPMINLVFNITLLDPAVVTVHAFQFTDGSIPQGGLVEASDGNFYGLTSAGGAAEMGTVFRLTRDGTVSTIHDFSFQEGGDPKGNLIQGKDGYLYGITSTAVMRFTLDGTATQVHLFSGGEANASSSLVQARDGNFYGVTNGGVFKLTPDGVYTVLASFSGGSEGWGPSTLIQGADGNLYGTTRNGNVGTAGPDFSLNGTVFKLTPDGVLTTLNRFAQSEGSYPSGALVQASDGSFYGTTSYGGDNNEGTVFRMTPDGVLTRLHSFLYVEGARPSPLTLASDGYFYGTASNGGDSSLGSMGEGTLFRLSSDGMLTTFHIFDRSAGYIPDGGLTLGSDGNLYGTTAAGGGSDGTVFKRALAASFTYTPPVPVATLAVNTPEVTLGNGGIGLFTVTLSTPQNGDTIIHYTIKGTGINGTDYLVLKGTKKIKAGKTSKPIKIIPQGDLGGLTKKTVKITLADGDGYTVGTTAPLKLKILAAP